MQQLAKMLSTLYKSLLARGYSEQAAEAVCFALLPTALASLVSGIIIGILAIFYGGGGR